MTVLHVLNSPRAEGTVRLALDWLAQPQWQQEVLLLQETPADLTPELQTHAAWLGSGGAMPRGARKFPWIFELVRRVCRARGITWVICWNNGFSPWVLAGARAAGVRHLIAHAGNPPTRTLQGRVQTAFGTGVAWLVGGKLVCCSHYVADNYAASFAVPRSVLRVVYNCAPVKRICDEAAASRRSRWDWRLRLVMVATLEAHKDHATLLRALPALLREFPGLQLDLVGDGTLRAKLVGLCAELGIDSHVHFLGMRRDVPGLLGQADVFVFSTTEREGLGTVLVEAVAAGLPIVASDVPACREVLTECRTGRLVPAGDASALAHALRDVLRHVSRETAVPIAGPALEQFSPARMMSAYLTVNP